MTSSPGRRYRRKVLPSTISAPMASRSSGVIALTVPYVPTGMNAGVSTVPRPNSSRPRRAAPSRANKSNRMGIRQQKHRVTVAEKSIPRLHRVGIGSQQGVAADKGRAQHEEGRLGQMKISHHGIHGSKRVSRPDENASGAAVRS